MAIKSTRALDSTKSPTFRIVTPQNKVKKIVSRGYVFYNLGNPVLNGVA